MKKLVSCGNPGAEVLEFLAVDEEKSLSHTLFKLSDEQVGAV